MDRARQKNAPKTFQIVSRSSGDDDDDHDHDYLVQASRTVNRLLQSVGGLGGLGVQMICLQGIAAIATQPGEKR